MFSNTNGYLVLPQTKTPVVVFCSHPVLGSVSEPGEAFVRNQNIFLGEAKFVRWTNNALVLPGTSASVG